MIQRLSIFLLAFVEPLLSNTAWGQAPGGGSSFNPTQLLDFLTNPYRRICNPYIRTREWKRLLVYRYNPRQIGKGIRASSFGNEDERANKQTFL